MALQNDDLTVWEIGFRWAGRDPVRWWWRIPLSVRDNFRVLMDAILNAHLSCWNISLEKRPPENEDAPPEMFIRYHLDEINACIEGVGFDRRLLRYARIEQAAFRQWCERRAIPLPEFWFPPGWQEYQWPDDGPQEPVGAASESVQAQDSEVVEERDLGGLRPVQRARIACQQIARALWKAEPTLTIAAMIERDEIQRLGGAARWVPEVVQRWLSEVDERDPSKKRGRRKGS